MPNDAKLGLLVGMALVLFIGLMFFRRESPMPAATAAPAPAAKGTPSRTELKTRIRIDPKPAAASEPKKTYIPPPPPPPPTPVPEKSPDVPSATEFPELPPPAFSNDRKT